ncbi:heme exporter protein CcmD [Hyphobacterium marinum]|uniref:Heme exporter protein D n=1 Tax=Hyphobacterium marinum TaxID=3116574 RepID=A0ABU7LVF3_9PROT|nr:heme exporter protein CcmD [Hyphobacterium sp. Y6023]MEE2565541.1 heme exporter protein CcmD [Hyphobacterium sp. Y6023]
MSEYLAMGGHAAFIWPAWGLTALGVAGLIAFVLAERRAARKRLAREETEAGR